MSDNIAADLRAECAKIIKPQVSETPCTRPGATADEIRAALAGATPDACWIWPFAMRGAYPKAWFEGRNVNAHRIVCELAHGSPPPGTQAAHKCGVPRCINPHHLRWATPKSNNADKLQHDTHNRGSLHNLAKLSPSDISEIRQLAAAGRVNKAALGRHYGVSRTAIYLAITGKNWGWLQTGAPK